MAASSKICAHNNPFNHSVTAENALYFDNSAQIGFLLENTIGSLNWQPFIQNNLNKIRSIYSWEKIIDTYYHLFLRLLQEKP